jgi:hypothetical protein
VVRFSDARGFGIRIGKNRKAWVITKGSDRQRITLGRYPP